MPTRKDELDRLLKKLFTELPDPEWVALVDNDGLVVACVPDEIPAPVDAISAMTAAGIMLGNRVTREIEAGELRYVVVAGSERQHLTVSVREDRLLSIGLKPEVAIHTSFRSLGYWLPRILTVLQMPMQ